MWPRLSDGYLRPRDLNTCQHCSSTELVSRWMEHDEQDQPTAIVILLCKKCSDGIIEPHPRLYKSLDPWEPFPGAMPICVGCKYHDSLRCKHPDALTNGGTGLKLTFPQPIMGFVDGRDKKTGKRFGSRYVQFTGPVSECIGKEILKNDETPK